MGIRRWSPLIVTLVALPVIAAAGSLPRPDHLYLEAESPRQDTTLVDSPSVIMLWFSQEPLPNTTEIRLLNETGAAQTVSKVRGDPDDPFHFVADVTGKLPAGKYKVFWRTYSDDEPGGLLRDGSFQFSVRAP